MHHRVGFTFCRLRIGMDLDQGGKERVQNIPSCILFQGGKGFYEAVSSHFGRLGEVRCKYSFFLGGLPMVLL